MARYYFIPIETDQDMKNQYGYPDPDTHCPKYLPELGNARGVTDWNRFQNLYYIIIIEDDQQDMTQLESHADVVNLQDATCTKAFLQSLGIAVQGNPNWEQRQNLLITWLTGESGRNLVSL